MRATHALIDIAALQHNFQVLQHRAGSARVVAVIKADGYGHGMLTVARALPQAAFLAVATIDEAMHLRQAGIDTALLVLQGFKDQAELAQTVAQQLVPVVHAPHQVRLLQQSAARLPQIWLKLQTGMHRLGLCAADYLAAHSSLSAQSGEIVMMSHFACAEQVDHASVAAQIACFDNVCHDLSGTRSLANSAALWSLPHTHHDWVRPGIMLYGVAPFADRCGRDLGLRPALRLYSELLAIQPCRKGQRVGYGLRFQCQTDTRIGIVAIGYGDGYPRLAADGTPVQVVTAAGAQAASLAGVPSMDMLSIDLGAHSKARVGDQVELWGDAIALETVARHAGTIPYELLCQLTARVPLRVA